MATGTNREPAKLNACVSIFSQLVNSASASAFPINPNCSIDEKQMDISTIEQRPVASPSKFHHC